MIRPGPSVLESFGFRADAAVIPLAGGQGSSWRVGDAILKPAPDQEEAAWVAEVFHSLAESAHFRVPRPLPAAAGWLANGWSAWNRLPGTTGTASYHHIEQVSTAFHKAVAHLQRPSWLDARTGPWAYADRIAWEELAAPRQGFMAREIALLAEMRRPIPLPSQIIHPDMAGNILMAPEGPPAVIDWPPTWRPALWSLAISVVDLLDTGAAGLDVLDFFGRDGLRRQLLIRAELFRLVVKNEVERLELTLVDDKFLHEQTIDSLIDDSLWDAGRA